MSSDRANISAKPPGIISQTRNVLTEGGGFNWLMLGPALAVLILVVVVPIVKAVLLSFDRVVLTRPALAGHFTLYNFEKLATSAEFWNSLATTAIYTLGTALVAASAGMAAALLTRRVVRAKALIRGVFILPWGVPALVAALIWGIMYDGNAGVINMMLRSIGIVDGRTDWLIDRYTVLPALILVQAWNDFPLAYIFLLTGLQNIPEELYEAASIDGAPPIKQFFYITMPQLWVVLTVVLALLMVQAFRSFAIVFLLTGGRTQTLTVQTFNAAFRNYDFSYAATIGVVSIAISLALVLVHIAASKRSASRMGAE